MRFLTIVTLSFVIICTQVQAVRIFVPSQQPTIQAGIDVASEGDTVLVAQGTYTGDGNRDLTFNGKNILLRSLAGATATIIDCEADQANPHVGIILDNGEDTTSVIDGFTITNAYHAQWGYSGGAIYFLNGKANILNCIITNSEATGIFVGVFNDTTSCRISNCIIEGNRYGIYTAKFGTIIEDCIVRNNVYAGIEFSSYTEIRRCLVAHNQWLGITKSGGMWTPVALIENCTIVFNDIGFLYDITFPKVSDELIEVDIATIRNSIIAYNTSAGINNLSDAEGEYNCEYSNVYGNGNYNWLNDKYSHGDEFGNISLDPLFCDTADNNFSLTENSPCAIDNNPSGSTIGAYGVGCGCCVGIRGNVDGDDVQLIDISDLVALVDCMFFDCLAVCEEELDMDASGIYDISDLVYLVDFMFTGGPEPLACN